MMNQPDVDLPPTDVADPGDIDWHCVSYECDPCVTPASYPTLAEVQAMQDTTVTGHVRFVEFQPFGDWFLSVVVDELQLEPTGGSFQIDSADFFIDGRSVTRAELLVWLAGPKRPAMARCALTGNWQGYKTCDKAEFFSPEVPP
jgi:hypothetical protein